jgi:hypothetical protein
MTDMAGLSSNPCVGARRRFQRGMIEAVIIATVRRSNSMIVWYPEMKVGHYVDPEQMTRSYFARFSTDWTQTHIQRFGVPPGTQMLSAPL